MEKIRGRLLLVAHLLLLGVLLSGGLFAATPAAADDGHPEYLPSLLQTSPGAGAFFISGAGEKAGSANSASVQVDAQGGMHVAYAGYYTGLNQQYDKKYAYYSYCPPSKDCSKLSSWSKVSLADNVQEVQLALTPAGHPRLLLNIVDQSATGSGYTTYWYAECDRICQNSNNWSIINLVNTNIIDLKIWDTSNHYFALDSQGNPRLVYGSGMLVLTFCNQDCTATREDSSGALIPANWYYLVIRDGLYFNQSSIAFTPEGAPRIATYVYNPDDFTFTIAYLECNNQCGSAESWTLTPFYKEGYDPSMVLRIDSQGRPRMAIYQDNRLAYAWCNADCSTAGNWDSAYIGLAPGDGQDPDLAFDSKDLPRISFKAGSVPKDGGMGFGLGYAWCERSCQSDRGLWRHTLVDDSGNLEHDWPRPRPANCTVASWVGGFRSSLSLDSNGNPRIAYDSEHWYSSCYGSTYYYPDVHTDAKGVRLVYFNQLNSSGQ